MKKISLLVLLSLIIISGCAASVRYTERVPGFQPGYVDEQLGEGTYQVRIGEAWPKDWPNLEKFALYRAADITKGLGKEYFTVTRASTEITGYSIDMPSTTQTNVSATRVGNSVYGQANSITQGGGTATFQGGWYYLDFKVINSSDTSSFDKVFYADSVLKDLKIFIDNRR
jgi:hypothetical protein